MQGVFSALSEKYGAKINFYTVEAEAVPEVSEMVEITVVPTFVAFAGKTIVGKTEGANPAELSKLAKQLLAATAQPVESPVESEHDRVNNLNIKLTKLTKLAPVTLFMKGSPTEPRCGFSRQIVEILNTNEIPFASFDILSDQDVRQGLKTFSDWPTFPQLYVKGEFMGGLDIVKEMAAAEGGLKQQLGVSNLDLLPSLPPPPQRLEERLQMLITKAPIMAFIKGSPNEPKCGFSRTLVGLLSEQQVSFEYFNILEDEEVRQGLKTFSDWPTYPQLYANGELVGGLDIVKEMIESGDFKGQLGI